MRDESDMKRNKAMKAMSGTSYLTDHYDEKIKKIKEINAPIIFCLSQTCTTE